MLTSKSLISDSTTISQFPNTRSAVKRPASENLMNLTEVKRISKADAQRQTNCENSRTVDISAVAGLGYNIATNNEDGSKCAKASAADGDNKEMPSTPRRIIHTVKTSLQSRLNENGSGEDENLEQEQQTLRKLSLEVEEEGNEIIDLSTAVQEEDFCQQADSPHPCLLEQQTSLDSDPLPFHRSPYEGGLILRESVPKRFEAMHPLDHPLLRFFPSNKEAKKSLYAKMNGIRKNLNLTLTGNTITICPLCSVHWCPPKNNFSVLVRHYEDVHWNWRRIVSTAQEDFILFPCYRSHNPGFMKRLIHNSLFSKNPIENEKISGLTGDEANLLSIINTMSIKNLFSSPTYSEEHLNGYLNLLRPLVLLLKRNFGYNELLTDNVSERSRIMDNILQNKSDLRKRSVHLDLFGIIIESLPHWHCPFSRSDFSGGKKVYDFWHETLTVEEWFQEMDTVEEQMSTCNFTTLDYHIMVEHVKSHYNDDDENNGSEVFNCKRSKNDDAIVEGVIDVKLSPTYIALAEAEDGNEDDELIVQPYDTVAGTIKSDDTGTLSGGRRVSFNPSVEVVEIDLIESRMEQYGSLQDGGCYSWDLDEETDEDARANEEKANEGTWNSPSPSQSDQEYIIMIRKDDGTLKMIKGVEISRMNEKEESELPVIYCSEM